MGRLCDRDVRVDDFFEPAVLGRRLVQVDLADDPNTHALWLASDEVRAEIRREWMAVDNAPDPTLNSGPEMAALQRGLFGWAIRWHLTEDWIISWALRALRQAADYESFRGERFGLDCAWTVKFGHLGLDSEAAEVRCEPGEHEWRVFSLSYKDVDDGDTEARLAVARRRAEWRQPDSARRRMVLRHEGWCPVTESRAVFRMRFLKEAEDVCSKYLKEYGAVLTHLEVAPSGVEQHHLDALARRDLDRQTVASIAEEVGHSVDTVKRAIRDLPDRMGYEGARLPAGRPKKRTRRSGSKMV